MTKHTTQSSSSSRMHVINHNWSHTTQWSDWTPQDFMRVKRHITVLYLMKRSRKNLPNTSIKYPLARRWRYISRKLVWMWSPFLQQITRSYTVQSDTTWQCTKQASKCNQITKLTKKITINKTDKHRKTE